MTDDRIAALFDIDGTLVDSNYLHVAAWQHAFQTLGEDVEAWRVHRAIGQDSSLLISSLVGDREESWVERATELHGKNYTALAPRLRAFDETRQLLRTLSDRGAVVVLATSASPEELDILLRVIDADDAIDATTNAEDVDAAKPKPDIVEVALERAGVDASRAVFIGDSVWDMKAAERAGVSPFGVLSGGIAESLLTQAGARIVFENAADLLARIDEIDLFR